MRRSVLLPLAVFAIVLGAVLLRGAPRLPVPAAAARSAALADPAVRDALGAVVPDRTRVLVLDAEQDRVSLYRGPRLLANAAVDRSGDVTAVSQAVPGGVVIGDARIHAPLGLAALALLLMLVCAPARVRDRRTLDLLLLISPAAPILLYDARLTTAGDLAAGAVLLALMARMGLRALRPEREFAPKALLADRLGRGVSARTLALAAGAVALIVTLASQGVADTGQAALRGATQLVDGTLPYGHGGGGIVHGDTYPPLLYLLYAPVAALAPFRDAFFDNDDGALWMTALGTVAVAALLRRAGGREAGWRSAAAWFAFAPALLASSGGSSDVWVSVVVAGLLAAPAAAGGGLIGIGIWTKIAPVVLLPLWAARLDGRGRARMVAGVAAATAAALALVVALGGVGGLGALARALSFQLTRQSVLSVWDPGGLRALQGVAEAALAAGIVALSMRVARDRSLAEDPGRMAALAALALLGLQLCGSYWSPTYLAWAFPALAVALLVPARPVGGPAAHPRRAAPTSRSGAARESARVPATSGGGPRPAEPRG